MPEKPGEARDVALAYDSWAATYDSDRNLTRDLDAEVLRRAGPTLAGRDVLELGGGTGKNTVWLAGQARSVTTLDFSAAMIARARDRVRAAHVTFVEHDLRQRWPVSEAAVDVVVANLVLEHIEHLKPIYAEAARVLRTGGEFFLCELHPERQRLGGRAEFTDKSGGTVQVAAYRHSVTEFLNEAIASGFAVCRVGEHLEDDAPRGASPRLFSAHFMKM